MSVMATRESTKRRQGWGTNWGASLIRFHLQHAEMDEEDRADLAALADSLEGIDEAQMAVWRFARDFARTSGDSASCNCVNCRAYRAVHKDSPAPTQARGASGEGAGS